MWSDADHTVLGLACTDDSSVWYWFCARNYALFLYSLLPIVRNAITALVNTDPTLVRVSLALGLSPWEQLRYLRLPLATPAIFAGIRTAAVISIGTATLAAFIGAGGLGEPIVVGLSLNDTDMILRGAVPAAILAVIVELFLGHWNGESARQNKYNSQISGAYSVAS